MPGVPLPSLLSAPARWVDFKAARIRWPEWLVAISALVLLLIMLGMSWFTISQASGGTRSATPASAAGGQPLHPQVVFTQYSINGWRGLAHAHWLLVVTILMAFGLLLLQLTRRSPAVPVTVSLFVMFLAGLSAVWLIVRVGIDPPGGRDAGGWVALICTLLLTFSAFKSLQLEGIASEDEPEEIPTVPLADLPPSAQPQ